MPLKSILGMDYVTKNHGISAKRYHQVHHWLRKNYGKAKKCEDMFCRGKSKIYNWALIPGKKYEEIRENFKQLCRSCHAKKDLTEAGRKHLSEVRKGIPMPKAIYKQLSKKMKGIARPKAHTIAVMHGWHKKKMKKILKTLADEVKGEIEKLKGVHECTVGDCPTRIENAALSIAQEIVDRILK